ncbi:MAG: BrnT family toxin [Chloroflexi bacterium]|nr:BrnT family toxin [Chloroflexota bacterium]
MRFEWDPVKAAKNFRKHGVSFPEAATIFNDPDFITVIDDEHSIDEDRFITIGLSNQGRLLMLAHTDAPGIIRIISARKATRSEGEFYAKTE